MKTLRLLLFLPGLGALAWGAVLFAEYAFPLRPDVFGTFAWLVGGPLSHDLLVAPLVGAVGLALSEFLPERWRTPVKTGAALTGVLALLAVPLLWRPFGGASNPGLHDADTGTGLLVTLGVVWLGVLVAALIPHKEGHA
ncbi:hypothetical protein [Amycolatopsis regifaucium]|uniref:Uncharacterized protein n=1 Tax=Amycolatopsis regifaucium TaxID=546365 RepID=A0A154MTH9_9PSEU|nr:hypothetical protein [Amycolatopsis regifaucium]KZB87410.1 hypothetical protein AVL48_22465 [Amycolatopsis regifaucium]OKA08245.1 hypothetical protein ATP06_0213225 [Amycolatopsis regifaucium]SFI44965.1 hypothetical protein SAMN04489731_110310 [Amycolatopsis regifaucium]